jgi:hypothetical protein
MRRAGVRLRREKYRFLQDEIGHLGHIVDHCGVRVDPQKAAAIRTAPSPRDKQALESWLGTAQYYSDFIPGFASLAAPLNELPAVLSTTSGLPRGRRPLTPSNRHSPTTRFGCTSTNNVNLYSQPMRFPMEWVQCSCNHNQTAVRQWLPALRGSFLKRRETTLSSKKKLSALCSALNVFDGTSLVVTSLSTRITSP